MKKILLISAAICLIACNLNAQVPGYLGKRFFAGYGLFINPNFDKLYNGWDESNSAFIRLRHNFTADYVTGRKSVTGIDFDINQLSYDYTAFKVDEATQKEITYRETAHVRGFTYGFHFTLHGIFKHNPVAPLGDYLRFKFFNINYTTNMQEQEEAFRGRYDIVKQSFNTPGLGIGYGQARVLFDAMVMDFGLEWSWLAKNAGFLARGPLSRSGSSAENVALDQLHWYYLVNFKLGFAGLLF